MPLERISATRWKSLPRGLQVRIRQHALTVLAAGVGFYAFLALVPMLVVIVSVYGLFANPNEIEAQVNDLAGALPEEARAFVTTQLQAITSTESSNLTITAVASTLVALWSSSAGISNLMKGVAVAFGTTDSRSYAVRRGLAIAITFGAVVLVTVSIALIAVLPAWLADTGMGTQGRLVINLLRFPAIALFLLFGLSVLYHWSRPNPDGRPSLMTWGSLIATGLWVISSLGFSWYTANFDSYNETYGSLGVIVVILLWLWISALVVLLGAEIDAEFDSR